MEPWEEVGEDRLVSHCREGGRERGRERGRREGGEREERGRREGGERGRRERGRERGREGGGREGGGREISFVQGTILDGSMRWGLGSKRTALCKHGQLAGLSKECRVHTLCKHTLSSLIVLSQSHPNTNKHRYFAV